MPFPSPRIEPKDEPNAYRLIGEFAVESLDVLCAFLLDHEAVHEPVILDLSGVTFLDSTAVNALIRGSRSVDGSGPLHLVNLSDRARRILEIVLPNGLPSLRIEGFPELPERSGA